MKKRLCKWCKYLLVVLFLSYYTDCTLFLHTHVFPWGTVTHSHPYKSDTPHTHSMVEFQTIAQLAHYVLNVFTPVVLTVFSVSFTLLYALPIWQMQVCRLFHPQLRAPPLSVFPL